MLEVTSETLKLRSGPGTNYDVIEELASGDMVTYIETDGEWLRVRVDVTGHIGYLKSQFVK